jgi:hypothetical protein
MNAVEEMPVGVLIPARLHAREKVPPGFVIFVRIKFVRLVNEDLAVSLRLVDKRRLVRGQARRLDNRSLPRHSEILAPIIPPLVCGVNQSRLC